MINYLQKHFKQEQIKRALNANRYYRADETTKKKKGVAKKIVDLDVCKKLYTEFKLPMYKIAMLYEVSDVTIAKYLKQDGTTFLRGHHIGENSFNPYFKKIDTPQKAYILGLIIADGGIVKDKRNGAMSWSISLTEADKYLLEKISKEMKLNKEPHISHGEDEKPRYCLRVNSNNMCNDLIKLGIDFRKSTKETFIPARLINEELLPHIVRGIFDGDGIAKKEGYLGFCGGNMLMHQILDLLAARLGVRKNKATYNKTNHIWYIQWG